jgi:methyltransferase (TIGR00027 family)
MSSTLAAQRTVSLTAYDCAAVRAAVYAVTKCESFDYLAADMVSGGPASFRARFAVALVKAGGASLALTLGSRVSPGIDVFMFARTAVGDDLIREALTNDGDAQVVILGAGLDTSGLRIGAERKSAELNPGHFFEVDLPAMQSRKLRHIDALLARRKSLSANNIRFVKCSFGDDGLQNALIEAGFDRSKRTVWIWSGVVHYLTEEAVMSTIAEMKTLSPPGSLLYFDFILLEAYERPDEYGFRSTKARFDSFGEVMTFGFRQGVEHVGGWLAEQGINFVRSYTNKDMVLFYKDKTGCEPRSEGTLWSNLCIARF